jgi:hypothetical protein
MWMPSTVGRAELKYRAFSLLSSFGSIGSSMTTVNLSSFVTPGTGADNRIGNAIWVKGVTIKGVLVGGQTGTALDDEYNSFRIAVLITQGAGAPYLTPPNNYVSEETAGCEIIAVKDFLLTSPNALTTGYQAATKVIDMFVPLNILVAYGSTTSKGVNVAMISDSSTSPSPGFANGQCILTYIDA